MRTIVWAAFLGAAVVAVPAAQSSQGSRTSDSLERAFVTNGKISMDLSAGEYRISGSPANTIRLEWSARDADRLSRVRARAEIRGSDAAIRTDGPGNHFRVAIQVPARSDLYVRLTAGELTLEGVEGNKDVQLHAGELRIDVGRAEDYRSVDASVWAGELHAAPFHASKEGLFRSFDWTGKGPYRLHAGLKAGELHLYSKAPIER